MTLPLHLRLVIDSSRHYGRDLLAGVLEAAEQAGGWRFDHSDRCDWARLPAELTAGGHDACICDAREAPQQDALRASTTPLVVLGADLDANGLPVVAEDNRAVGRMAAEHLCGLGLRRLAFWPSGRAASYRQREEGLRAAARSLGAEVQPAAATLAQLLAGLRPPAGILAATDERALEVLQACDRAGRSVPGEIAVLGVGDDALACRLARPSLSSIDHGLRAIGAASLRLAARLARRERGPRQLRIAPAGVVRRASTDLLAVEEPLVARAVRQLRAGLAEGLRPDDLLQDLAVSRPTLDAAFRRCLGCSAAVFLRRERLRQAEELLADPLRSAAEVAALVGLPSPSALSVLFRNEHGCGPRNWRALRRSSPAGMT